MAYSTSGGHEEKPVALRVAPTRLEFVGENKFTINREEILRGKTSGVSASNDRVVRCAGVTASGFGCHSRLSEGPPTPRL